MALDIVSVSPVNVEDNGGYELSIHGTFDLVNTTVKLIQGVNQYNCFASRAGRALACFPVSSTLLCVATPILPVGVYTLSVQQGVTTDTITNAVTISLRTWKSKTFELRRLLPPKYKAGARNINALDLL
jgi:hypothetical protein